MLPEKHRPIRSRGILSRAGDDLTGNGNAVLELYKAGQIVATIRMLLACTLAAVAKADPPLSPHPAPVSDCRPCHASIVDSWSRSNHALAQVSVDLHSQQLEFATTQSVQVSGMCYTLSCVDGGPQFAEERPGDKIGRYTVVGKIGRSPLQQYIVALEGGRFQATELARDPKNGEWFNVFGNERRQPGEWGHWLGRGMNWNSMCAACHLTNFSKGYDSKTDTYHSSWTSLGVGCSQCHGEIDPGHVRFAAGTKATPNPAKAQETCAPCHARNEFLTGDIRPGEPYSDHYRLTLPTDPAVFYPDGQMKDEDFNYTSFLTSRRGGKAGVTCLDCHDPHSGKTVLPVSSNQLCLQCHAAPGRLHAPSIDPMKHSHHGDGSTGNLCVSCHMPTTVYMQRDARHDHGFLRPDPLMTKEAGIPNACNRCHADKSVDWAVEATTRWYGEAMESRQRIRTRAVIGVQAHADDAPKMLEAALAVEDIPAWRATLLLLARPYGTPALSSIEVAALKDPEPLVRSAAVQALSESPSAAPSIRTSLHDPSLLVRLDAEWALSGELEDGSKERAELDRYLQVSADQPAGRLRIAQDLFNRGHPDQALDPLKAALAWDPSSPVLHDTFGVVLEALGREQEAAEHWWQQALLSPADDEPAFKAGLAFAAASKPLEAEKALRTAVERNPRSDRGWYNLGLLLSQSGRVDEAIGALGKAEGLAPSQPDYPYALATVLLSKGQAEAAIAEDRRALQIDPNYAPAREFLRQVAR